MQYPKHIALIPDWNRTWAKELWKTSLEWHLEWFQRCIELAIHIFENTCIYITMIKYRESKKQNQNRIELSLRPLQKNYWKSLRYDA